MIKKTFIVLLSASIALVAIACAIYAMNPAPTVREVSAAEAAEPGKPYVVKLHARWCPACLMTKSAWSQIEETYSTSANLVVFDFTSQATTEASRAQASRLGLEKFFDENAGAPGTIAILDGRAREVMAEIHGSRDFAEYRAAIDAALNDMNE